MADTVMIFKPDDIMRILGLGRNTVYELLRCGRIRSVKVGKRYLVTQDAIDQFLSLNMRNEDK